MYSKIIFDVSNIFYRNYFTHKDFNTIIDNQKVESGGIYGTIKSIQSIEKKYATLSTEFYFLFDNFSSKDSYRKDLDPDYKLNRLKYDKSFYRSIDYLCLILLNYSDKFYCLQVEQYEADDLLPTLVNSFGENNRVLVVSDDLDFSRCLSENTHLLMHNEIFTPDLFLEKYKFYPTKERVVLWKTLKGDKSDNIPIPVPYIRTSKLLHILNNYNDVYDLLSNIQKDTNILGKKLIEEILNNKSRLILNYQLVNFIDISYDILLNYLRKGSYNPNTLRFFYKSLNFKISEIDTRLLSDYPIQDSENEYKNFFQYEKIPRKE